MISAMGMPSLSVFGGTYASSELLNDLRREGDPLDFFGSSEDLLSGSINRIRTAIVEPIRKLEERVRRQFHYYQNDDFEFTALTHIEDYANVPECLHMPILQFAPVRKAFDNNTIHGFGYEHIPAGDPYEQLLKNGVVDVDEVDPDENGEYNHISIWTTDDPDIANWELDVINDTRSKIEWLLANSDIDFTDYPNLRG